MNDDAMILDGIKVLDFSQYQNGPTATMMLSDCETHTHTHTHTVTHPAALWLCGSGTNCCSRGTKLESCTLTPPVDPTPFIDGADVMKVERPGGGT